MDGLWILLAYDLIWPVASIMYLLIGGLSEWRKSKSKESLETFGCVEPIVWNKRTGNIVGGHQRFKVAKDLGYTEDNVVVVDLEDTQEKSLNLALNKVSGQWRNQPHS